MANCLRCFVAPPTSNPVAPPRLAREDSWKYVNRFAPPKSIGGDDAHVEQPLQDSYRDPLFAALNGKRPPSFREQMVPQLGSASRMKQLNRIQRTEGAASTGGSTRTGSAASSSSRSSTPSGRRRDGPSFMTPTAAMAEAFAKKAELANARATAAAASAAAKALTRKPVASSSSATSSIKARAAARVAAQRAAAAAAAYEPYLAPATPKSRHSRGTLGQNYEAVGQLPTSYMATTKSTAQGKKTCVDHDGADSVPSSPWKAGRRDWERMRWDEKYAS